MILGKDYTFISAATLDLRGSHVRASSNETLSMLFPCEQNISDRGYRSGRLKAEAFCKTTVFNASFWVCDVKTMAQ